MPEIQPIPAVTFATDKPNADISSRIAPPYDVLFGDRKPKLIERDAKNIAAVDLPHLPPKTVGPDEAYLEAGKTYREWLADGTLVKHEKPAFYAYQQTYTVDGHTFKRRGLIANVTVQPFGKPEFGGGGIFPHEQTFSAAKEDRLKLMRATEAQLSPIFGIYSDPTASVAELLAEVIDAAEPSFHGTTDGDGVLHEVWEVADPYDIGRFKQILDLKDIFIADGHHRYNTALNYKNELVEAGKDPKGAKQCLFVLISMQDRGMIVLPTHRVLGNMPGFTMQKFIEASAGKLAIEPFAGADLNALEQAVKDSKHPHTFGLYDPAGGDGSLYLAHTVKADPLLESHLDPSFDWRQLDVAILQSLIVEQICEPTFVEGEGEVTWKFPHELDDLKVTADSEGFQLGVVMKATPLDSVRKISEHGELMPQKSTFFYPKLATGLVINPLD